MQRKKGVLITSIHNNLEKKLYFQLIIDSAIVLYI